MSTARVCYKCVHLTGPFHYFLHDLGLSVEGLPPGGNLFVHRRFFCFRTFVLTTILRARREVGNSKLPGSPRPVLLQLADPFPASGIIARALYVADRGDS